MEKLEKYEAKMQAILKESQRIFADFCHYDGRSEYNLIGCTRLIKAIFDKIDLPDHSAAIEGILLTLDKLPSPYGNILKSHYFDGISFTEIACINKLSQSRISVIHSDGIKLMCKNARHFYFPKRREFLTKYATFLEAIQSRTTSGEDISVHNLGLSTHTANALYRNGVFTASQMFYYSEEDLMKLRNMGTVGVEEVFDAKLKLLMGNI
ncbi:MAG: hypothetical protein IJ272_10025 [Clostridia bacterium]|nr:hypothetical protein [Clostridia bacterium]